MNITILSYENDFLIEKIGMSFFGKKYLEKIIKYKDIINKNLSILSEESVINYKKNLNKNCKAILKSINDIEDSYNKALHKWDDELLKFINLNNTLSTISIKDAIKNNTFIEKLNLAYEKGKISLSDKNPPGYLAKIRNNIEESKFKHLENISLRFKKELNKLNEYIKIFESINTNKVIF